MPKLVIFRGDAVENELRLAGRPVRIGRDTRNDIVLDDKSVSRFHAEVRAEGNQYFIVDLKSRNGVWMNGQQAKGKAALAFGAPVTLGAFELALEDDVSTGEFDELAPVIDPPRGGKTTQVDTPDRPSASGTRASMRAPVTSKRQVILWSVAAAAVLLVCVVIFALVRYSGRPPSTGEVVNPPAAPPSPQVRVVQPAPPPEDPTKVMIDQHLAAAQTAQTSSDYAALREHATRVLELDPDNQAAREFKRLADAGLRGAKPLVTVTTTSIPPTPTEVETPGIPRKPGEAWPAYASRVEGIKVNFELGKNYLAKQSYALALPRFRAVAADAPKYQGVDALIIETLAKQKVAFDEAMSGGDQNEKANKLHDARVWYQRAMDLDPNSTAARDKNAALFNRMNKEAGTVFNQATASAKLGRNDRAIQLLNQIMESMLPGDEIRDQAAKELERLKR